VTLLDMQRPSNGVALTTMANDISHDAQPITAEPICFVARSACGRAPEPIVAP
jgi:hypothetical protein